MLEGGDLYQQGARLKVRRDLSGMDLDVGGIDIMGS